MKHPAPRGRASGFGFDRLRPSGFAPGRPYGLRPRAGLGLRPGPAGLRPPPIWLIGSAGPISPVEAGASDKPATPAPCKMLYPRVRGPAARPDGFAFALLAGASVAVVW